MIIETSAVTNEAFNILQPNIEEVKRLAYEAHLSKWAETEATADYCQMPLPLHILPTDIKHITVSSLYHWILIALNHRYDWKVCLEQELKRWQKRKKDIESRLKSGIYDQQYTKYYEMVARLDIIFFELFLDTRGFSDFQKLGKLEIEDGYKSMIV